MKIDARWWPTLLFLYTPAVLTLVPGLGFNFTNDPEAQATFPEPWNTALAVWFLTSFLVWAVTAVGSTVWLWWRYLGGSYIIGVVACRIDEHAYERTGQGFRIACTRCGHGRG